jgi:Putative cyclase
MKSSMKKSQTIFMIVTIFMSGCTNKSSKGYSRILHIDNIVDLTHTLTPDFPFIPVKQLTYPFELIPMATLKENGVEANSWRIHEHLGTHIDAPNHFIENQKITRPDRTEGFDCAGCGD